MMDARCEFSTISIIFFSQEYINRSQITFLPYINTDLNY